MSWRDEQLKVMRELDPADPALARERRRLALDAEMAKMPETDHNGIPLSPETIEERAAAHAHRFLSAQIGEAAATEAIDAARAAGGDAVAQLWADVAGQIASERG